MEPGQFYLISCPWFWTFVGRFVRQINFQEVLISDAIYFTKTGKTFDKLVKDGVSGSTIVGPFDEYIIPAGGTKTRWYAATPWATKRTK